MYNVVSTPNKIRKVDHCFMDNIMLYLLKIIQEQYQQICWLILFICRYIPLKQWAHDELHSPKYQKFLTDELPVIKPFIKQDWQLWNDITVSAMVKRSLLSSLRKGKHVRSLMIPYALSAVLHTSLFTIIPAAVGSSNARSASRPSSTVLKSSPL